MDQYSRNMLLVAAFMLLATALMVATFMSTISVSLPLAVLSALFGIGTASATSFAVWCALTKDTE